MARLYDEWSSLEKTHFNPDGSMKEEYRNFLIANGMTLESTFRLEVRKKKEVELFNETEQIYLEEYGIGYTEYCLRAAQKERRHRKENIAERQRKALANGEEQSTLPDYIEPDEYYDYYSGDYSGGHSQEF